MACLPGQGRGLGRVKDKAEAFQAFHRVLRPGGRISLFEPINALMLDPDRLLGYDITPVMPLAAKLKAFYASVQSAGTNPMIDFDERDLLRHAEQAGFASINLELRLTVKDGKRPVPWSRALRMAGNPLVPPLGEVLDQVLSPPEIAEFTAHIKPLVESGTGRERQAHAYLAAARNQRPFQESARFR